MWGITGASLQKRKNQAAKADKKTYSFQQVQQQLQQQAIMNATKSPFSSQSMCNSSSNQSVQAFSFGLKCPLQQDQSCYWSYTVPFLKPNEKMLTIATQNFQTVLSNYVGDDYPSKISFAFRNLAGYSNSSGQVTTKFLVLNLVSTAIKNEGGLTSRDLIYKNQQLNVWSLGNLRSLQLQIYVNDETVPLATQLTTPIEVAFKIIHVSF